MKVVQIKSLGKGDLFPLPSHPGHFARVLKAYPTTDLSMIHVTYEVGCKHSFPDIVWGCFDREAEAEIRVYDAEELEEHNKYRVILASQLEAGMTFHLKGDRTDWYVSGLPRLNGSLIHVHVHDPAEGRFENFELEPDRQVLMKEE